MKKINIVALLAREPGLDILKNVLLKDQRLNIVKVISHRKLPKAEGGEVRDDAAEFESICHENCIDLLFLDFPEAKRPEDYLLGQYDLLVSLSWRFILSPEMIAKFRMGTLNIHRGALPAYKGAEPVRRAIEAGEKYVEITAHEIVEEIDAGPVIDRVSMPVEPCPASMSSSEYAEIVKKNLLSLYSPLVISSLDKLLNYA